MHQVKVNKGFVSVSGLLRSLLQAVAQVSSVCMFLDRRPKGRYDANAQDCPNQAYPIWDKGKCLL